MLATCDQYCYRDPHPNTECEGKTYLRDTRAAVHRSLRRKGVGDAAWSLIAIGSIADGALQTLYVRQPSPIVFVPLLDTHRRRACHRGSDAALSASGRHVQTLLMQCQ